MSFEKESSLVEEFVGLLGDDEHWKARHVSCEFNYQRGRTDVIAITDDGRVLAFEAKLTRWREALHQAQRNRCFAHETYVVLPREAAQRAFRYREEFTKRHVGLCTLEDGKLVILHLAKANSPVEPWLTEQAGVFARSSSGFGGRGSRNFPE
ncbi:MAG: hypothetical protein ACYCUI_14630 [Vulcanimicrobiaceae bacterium]